MPPFLSSCKACMRNSSSKGRILQLKDGCGLGLVRNLGEKGTSLNRFPQTRVLSSLAPIGRVSNASLINQRKETDPCVGNLLRNFQIRRFLGCGDGEEGSGLAKTYEERLVMGYSPEQLFAVVAAVDLYEDFLPWCQRSRILRRNENGSFDAELEIGFKFLVESYVSHVEMEKPKYIKTTASESAVFDHLINIWEFNPGPIDGTCDLHFSVDFKFQSPLYRQVASMFFQEVVSRLVGSFEERCSKIYGPAIPVQEKSYGQSNRR